MSKRARVSRAPKSRSSRSLRPRNVEPGESRKDPEKLAARDSQAELEPRKSTPPEAKAAEPEAKTAELEAKAAEPEAKAAEPETKAAEPEAKAAPKTKKAARASTPVSSVRHKTSDPSPGTPRDADADELTTSGISEDFFREDDSSLSPHLHGDDEVDEERAARLSLTPEQLHRRARLRRIVAGVVAFAGLLVVGVAVKVAVTDKASVGVAADQSRTAEPTIPGPSVPAVDEPAAPEAARPVDVVAALAASATADAKAAEEAKAAADAKAAEEAKAADAKAAEEAKAAADAKAAEEAKAAADAKAAEQGGAGEVLDKAAIAALRKKTESLLNRGKRLEAIASARELIAADPGEAMGYLFLGSALQDSGKWKEGIEAYSECVRHATRGPVHECRAMGGRK